MCGICGFKGYGDIKDLQRMTAALTHRGPDDQGTWNDQQSAIYLGHRRLSVIDIDGGAQPMWSSDDSIGIVYNGEIYNHLELRQKLEKKGRVFETDHSDTEVLLHGYREWGTDLPNRLNGMWVFAIYDRRRDAIFISRDRFGKKPLFYTLQNKTFVFASELTALAQHSFITASISKRSLKKYFAYGYIPAPSSLFEQIYKLPGGHNLIIDLNKLSFRVWKYWDFILEPFDAIPDNPEEVWGEQIRELLHKSVRRRLISDVPLGVFLSGGIDSSSITAFASQSLELGKLKTFSIGFQEESFDESRYAQSVSELFKTEHHLKILSMESSRKILPGIVKRLDEPMGDSSLLPTYLLCRETRKHVTVALGGDGGDEIFAGYDPFKAIRMAELYMSIIPRPVHQAIAMIVGFLPVSHSNMSLDFKLKRTLRGLSHPKKLWNPIWLGPLEPTDLDDLFMESTDVEEVYSEALDCWEACSQNNLVDKTLQFYTKLYLQNDILVKTDRASMMNSLEVRAPFLDIELVDFVRRIPHSWKYRNGQTKYILKKALEPVLPSSILYREKKGFGVPIGSWFKKGFLSIDYGNTKDILNAEIIKKMSRQHQQNKEDHRFFLWNLYLISLISSY
jgi:asparagine synthase (glutamine-hydrolysing)